MSTQRTRMTRQTTAVLFMDHQIGLMTGVRDMTVSDLKHNVVGLAKAAKVLELPIVAATTARDSMWGPTAPELKDVLGDVEIIDRSVVSAWDFPPFVDAVKKTNRDHLIIAGLAFEVCDHQPCGHRKAGKAARGDDDPSFRPGILQPDGDESELGRKGG